MCCRFLTFSHVKILYRTERHSQQDVAQKLNRNRQTTTKTTTVLTTTPTTTASSPSLAAIEDEQGKTTHHTKPHVGAACSQQRCISS